MTLTQVAIITKRAILTFIIMIILGIASFIGYQIWYANYLASLPPPEEKPDIKFGILPPPDFIPAKVSSSNFAYQVATETGGLPDFGKLTKVYFIPKATSTFLAEDKAKALAAKFNINTPPEASPEGQFKFSKESRTLQIDLDTGNFTYFAGSTPSGKASGEEAELIANFRELLTQIGIIKPELQDSPAKLVEGRIMIWPKDIDKKPIVTARFKQSLVKGVASQSANIANHYSSLDFTFWPVDETTFSTYPIKNGTLALEDLKKGKGTVVIEPKTAQVSITSVYIGYFESETYSPYLQPVFVFEGPNFVSYVPAITDEYINSATGN